MIPQLRQRLRDETRATHDRVDALMSAWDLTRAPSYAAFLAAHHRALTGLALDPAPYGLPPVRLAGLVREDLAALGYQAPLGPLLRLASEDERLGAYYVVVGSRLGARVLSERWAATDCPTVRSAGRYLGDRSMADGWKALNALFSSNKEQDEAAVLEGAEKTFAHFEAAARAPEPSEIAGAA